MGSLSSSSRVRQRNKLLDKIGHWNMSVGYESQNRGWFIIFVKEGEVKPRRSIYASDSHHQEVVIHISGLYHYKPSSLRGEAFQLHWPRNMSCETTIHLRLMIPKGFSVNIQPLKYKTFYINEWKNILIMIFWMSLGPNLIRMLVE